GWDAVGVSVVVLVTVAVSVGVSVGRVVSVGVLVAVAVLVGVSVAVAVGVSVASGVLVGESVGVDVWVSVCAHAMRAKSAITHKRDNAVRATTPVARRAYRVAPLRFPVMWVFSAIAYGVSQLARFSRHVDGGAANTLCPHVSCPKIS